MKISLRNAILGYGDTPVLSVPRFSVESGRVAGIVGLNGSGKTTLFKAMMGGADILRGDLSALSESDATVEGAVERRHVWYCPQRDFIFGDLSIAEHVTLACHRGKEFLENGLLDDDGFLSEVDGWSSIYRRLGRALSGGEKKTAALALASLSSKPIILLDEPSAGISEVLARKLLVAFARHVRQRGVGMAFIEHRFDLVAEVADDVYVVSDGVLLGPFERNEARTAMARLLSG